MYVKFAKLGAALLVEKFLERLENKTRGEAFSDADLSALAKAIGDYGDSEPKLCEFLESLTLSNFSASECYMLAKIIAESGKTLNISDKIGKCITKDSIGYISDSVSLIVMSVLASLGEKVVKLTSTKYGAFGNTISKLGMFDGFSAEVSETEFTSIAEEVGCAILENKGVIAPIDANLVKIMDRFKTPSIPLLACSLVAKNIALGASVVVYDVKSGEGGIVKTRDQAYKLAGFLVEVSKLAGIKAGCIVTTLNQPISASLGALAELKEVMRSLSSGSAYFDSDLINVSKEIVEIALILSGKAEGRTEAGEMFEKAILSLGALAKFKQIVLAFGGNFESVSESVQSILSGVATSYIEAPHDGYLADIDTQKLYENFKLMSQDEKGRLIDKNAGLVMLVREGTRVSIGEKIARITYSFNNQKYREALKGISSALSVKTQKPKLDKLLVKVFV